MGKLFGRAGEQAAIGRLLADARAGRSGVLVLLGEAGIGKSVLLQDAAGRAEGMRVLRTGGVSSEAELPFAGLHLLLKTVTDRIEDLPGGQAAALRGALGLGPARGADQFAVGVALLTLLSDLAGERGLLVLVDDAHWLDRASIGALVFAARRLDAEGVALLLAARPGEGDRGRVLAGGGLPELELAALDDEAADALLVEHAGELAASVRTRIIAEAGGNPLALLEMPRGLSAAQRLDSMAQPLPVAVTAAPVLSRVQASFADRFKQLPAPARTLLLVAAADDTGSLGVVVEAARRLGSRIEDAEPAERDGLIELTAASLVFRHPLVRAAVYRSSPLGERIAAHHALAAVLLVPEQADRRAWHLAAATVEVDETVAAALEQAANRARDRGGIAAVAAALERAAQLTRDPRVRAGRLVGAAEAALKAGQPDRAVALADLAAGVGDYLELRARIAAVRADVAKFFRGSPQVAAQIRLDGAIRLTEQAHATAASLLGAAAVDAWFGGDRVIADRAMTALEALPPSDQDDANNLAAMARALRRLLADEFEVALPLLHKLVAHPEEAASEQPVSLIDHPVYLAAWIGDDQAAMALAVEQVAACRAHGAIGTLPLALGVLAWAELCAGQHKDARAWASEGLRLGQDTGQVEALDQLGATLARLAAIEGDRARCEELAKPAVAEPSRRGLTLALSVAALNLLDVGLGCYDEVLERLDLIPRGTIGDVIMPAFSVPDQIEAAVRAGAVATAETLLERYQAWTSHTGQAWAAAVAHRCQALVHPDRDAQQHYAAALQLHADGRRPFERARTRLAYGQLLRRNRQRAEARAPLRAAWRTFTHLGAAPWGKQALAELRAAGETVQPPPASPDPLRTLTPQELRVVREAASGASNRDIGAQLFLSPRTVGYHLYKAFPKLGITSRHELTRLNLDPPEDVDQGGGS
ncbi:ATP-binding protein [Flindersiella endophytica]